MDISTFSSSSQWKAEDFVGEVIRGLLIYTEKMLLSSFSYCPTMIGEKIKCQIDHLKNPLWGVALFSFSLSGA